MVDARGRAASIHLSSRCRGNTGRVSLVFDPFSVAKHGSHDQSSHGNWARGGYQPGSNLYSNQTIVEGLGISGRDMLTDIPGIYEIGGHTQQMLKNMHGFTDGKLIVSIDSARTWSRFGETRVTVTGTVIDKDENEVGVFDRVFIEPEPGVPGSVEHLTFRLDPAHQGQGFTKAWFDHAFDEYVAAGYETVDVSTASVGSYAWAVLGARPTEDQSSTNRGAADKIVTDMKSRGYTPKAAGVTGLIDEVLALPNKTDRFEILNQSGWNGEFDLTTNPYAKAKVPTTLEELWDATVEWTTVVQKHGSHDQSSHGNWARGLSRSESSDAASKALFDHFYAVAGDITDYTVRGRMKDKIARTMADDVFATLYEHEIDQIVNSGSDDPVDWHGGNPFGAFDSTYMRSKSNEMSDGQQVEGYEGYIWEVAREDGIAIDRATQGPRELWDLMSDHAKARTILYSMADNTLGNWKTTALDHDEFAYNLQQTVNAMNPSGEHKAFRSYMDFQLTSPDGNGNPNMTNYRPFNALQSKVYGGFVTTSQRRTQAILNEVAPGSDSVTLYRGMTMPEDQAGQPSDAESWTNEVSMNPLSSWSVDPTVAKRFGDGYGIDRYDPGYLLTAAVPKSNIMMTAVSGLGALHEMEVIVNLPDGFEVEFTTVGDE